MLTVNRGKKCTLPPSERSLVIFEITQIDLQYSRRYLEATSDQMFQANAVAVMCSNLENILSAVDQQRRCSFNVPFSCRTLQWCLIYLWFRQKVGVFGTKRFDINEIRKLKIRMAFQTKRLVISKFNVQD
jgi:hypothetical protein